MPSAVLSSRRDAGGGLTLLGLEVGPELAKAYAVPGQYVELRTAAGKAYFVLAGEPGVASWELLVRASGEAAGELLAAPIGSSVEVSSALGTGFPAERARGRELVIAVVAGALGAARSLLRRRDLDGDARRTHVYIGARSASDVPLAREVDGWSTAGADVVLCLSRQELEHDGLRLPGARREGGYVQDVVSRDLETGRLSPAIVFAAGPTAMLAAMRGLPGSVLEVVTNY